jgi:hypothetical protein
MNTKTPATAKKSKETTMAKSMEMVKSTNEDNAVMVLPDFMREDAGMGTEGVDKSSMSMPRISLMHPTSVPVTNGEAKPGNFYHTGLREDIGNEIVAIPVYVEDGFTLWDPSNDSNAPLARGRKNSKGVWVWDPSNTKFDVIDGGKKVTWDTKGSVAESKLVEWSREKGAAPPPGKKSLNFLVVMPELGPHAFGVMSFQKSAYEVGSKLFENIKLRASGGPSFALKYKVESVTTTGKNGKKFLVPKFSYVGVNDSKDMYTACREMYFGVRETGLYGMMADESDHGEGDATVVESKDF